MNIEEFRQYCIAKKGITEEFPFDGSTLVFKVMGKMFALVSLDRVPLQASLKCNPERALELRESYEGIIEAAYHMNKTHWNSILLEGQLPLKLIRELVDHSYGLVVAGLTKKVRIALDGS